MDDHAGQIADRAIHEPPFVQIGAAADAVGNNLRTVGAKAAHQPFCRPAGGAHRAAGEHRHAPHAIAVATRKIAAQRRDEVVAQQLIGIEHEGIRRRNAAERVAARIDIPRPRTHFHCGATRLRHGRRRVGRLGIEDEYARVRRNACQRPCQTRGLVLRQDDDGELIGGQRRTSAPVPALSLPTAA